MNFCRRFASVKEVFKKLNFILNRRQKILGSIVAIMTVLNAALQTLGVSIIVPFMSAMIDPEKFMSQKYIAVIAKGLHIHEATQLFVILCVIIIVLYLLKDVFCVFQLWVGTKYSYKVQRELATSVLETYMSRSYDFFLNYGTTKIIRDIQTDSYAVNTIIAALISLLTEFLTMLFITIYIFIMDWRMAICIVAMAYICILIFYGYFKSKMRKAGEQGRKLAAESQKVLLEAVEGIKEVQVMCKQFYFTEEFKRIYAKEQKPHITQRLVTESPTYIIEGVFIIGLLSFIAARILIDPDYVKTMPVLASFLMGAVRMLPSLGRISSRLGGLSYDLPSLESVYNNMKGFKETEGIRRLQLDSGKNIVFKRDLNVQNISWRYLESEQDVLHNLNLKISKGQSIGIIGQSGAGKSTLADIILGLHIPQQGRVEIDGINIFQIPFEYSRVIGYVPQSIYLVDGTVKENVAFGLEEEKIDDNLVWQALQRARLDGFVRECEAELDTILGERGVRFSGGPRHRLAIARALYRQPQILVLDEATSALDNETESAVMDAIEGLYGSITMIIIAHRLTTVKKCDDIYEIKNGIAVRRDKSELFTS